MQNKSITASDQNGEIFLVTGATGNVGREVVTELLAAGHKPRLLTRDPLKVAHWGDRVDVAIADFEDAAAFARAVDGVTAIYLMHSGADQDAFARLIAAAAASGRPRVVFLSSIAVNQSELRIGQLHKRKEDTIRASGLHAAFVRPGAFMSNAYQYAKTIVAEGVVYNALGDTRFPSIAPEDVAAVAVTALLDPPPSGEAFELTGGELLSVPEQVAILAGVLDQPLQTVDVPVEVAVENMVRQGIPAPVATAVGESYAALRNGSPQFPVKDTVERVTGRKPMTFEAWARKHKSRFQAAAVRPAAGRGN